jgi:heat shock protein HslJ
MASPDRPLLGTLWLGSGMGDGNVVSLEPGSDQITLRFGADGVLEVFTGCVNGVGTYSASDTEISFEAIGYDDAECADSRLVGLSKQVMQVLDGSTLEYAIEERNLELHHRSGRIMFLRAE